MFEQVKEMPKKREASGTGAAPSGTLYPKIAEVLLSMARADILIWA